MRKEAEEKNAERVAVLEHELAQAKEYFTGTTDQLAAARKIHEAFRKRSKRAKVKAQSLRESIRVTGNWDKALRKMLKEKGMPREQTHLRALWECQIRCLFNKRHSCRWHPAIMSWCSDIYRQSPKAYQYEAFACGDVGIFPSPGYVRCAAPRHTAPHHNTPNYTAPRETTSRHTTPRCSAPQATCVRVMRSSRRQLRPLRAC